MQRWIRSRDSAVARALCASAVGCADGGAGGAGTAQPLDPRAVAQQIDTGEWRAIEAQDAHETLGRLLTALEEEDRSLRVLDQPPPPRAPLYGWSTVIRTCETCGASSDAILQTFSVLSLPLPTSNRSLAPSFIDAFASTDVDVQAHCEMCGSNEPHSRMHSIARFPRVLVLHLQKAFLAPDESIDASQYSTTFPEVLILPRGNPVPPIPRKLRYHEEAATANGRLVANGTFAQTPRPPPSTQHRGGVRYNLRGVVQHHGGAGSSAHFIAVVGGGAGSPEDGLAGLAGGRWWIVDDGRVRRGTRADALNSQSAYLLFYELMDDP
jgi:ubiquitin C-terminal hydrolase